MTIAPPASHQLCPCIATDLTTSILSHLTLGQEYLGATGLHLAIAYNNDELAQCIIENGVNIHIRARGTFFLPADQQHDTPLKVTDYSGLAYLGKISVSQSCMCRNDELSSTMSLVGCLLKDSELFILFSENSQILLKISVIPILLTFIYLVALLSLLVNNQLNSSSNSNAAHNCHTGNTELKV